MTTHTLARSNMVSKPRAFSRNLLVRLLCDEGFAGLNGTMLRDTSGNGNDFSPLFCQPWIPNVTIFVNVCYTPTVPNGFYYECTTGGTTGTTEPSWNASAGVTTNAAGGGSAVWTARALPDFWSGASSQWAKLTNAATTPSQTAARHRAEAMLWEFCAPSLAGPINGTASSWTSASNTVSATTSPNAITDSASGFPTTIVNGDWLKLTWTSPSDSSNSSYAKVGGGTPSNSSLQFSIGGINAAESNKILKLEKVLEPPALVFSCHIATTVTSGGQDLLQFLNLLVTTCGFKIILNGSRQIQFSASDLTGTASATTTTTALTNNIAIDTHVVVVVNRATASLEVFLNGTRDSQFTLTKRQMCALRTTLADLPQLDIGRRDQLSNGATQIRRYEIYCGRNLPVTLTGSGSPALIAQLAATSLSPSDWA